MRLRAIAFAGLALGAAAFGAYALAERAAIWVERATATQLGEALHAAGEDWVEIATDGLTVEVSGEAPNEASRFRGLQIARRIVDGRRLRDRVAVRAEHPSEAPDFALEILRNEAEVSLIGLVPREAGRGAIQDGLATAGLGSTVTDMLETADFAAPQGWELGLRFGLALMAELPRAKISVTPGRVAVATVSESAAAKRALEAALAARRPEGVALDLAISAPRPVISPFAAAFALQDGAGRLEACSAETEAGAETIRAAARAAGIAAPAECAIGLGAPAPEWAAAVARGIGAVAELGGGRFEIADLAAVLTGPEGIASERLLAVAGRLDAGLPAVVTLETRLPPPVARLPDGTEVYAPAFEAVLEDGTARLTGRLYDATSQAAVQGFAQALFGHDKVRDTTVVDPNLPAGWPVRVLAGVEALALLEEGALQVTPERVALEGWGIEADASAAAEALIAAKAGGEVLVEVAYDAAAAAAAAAEARPLGEVCADAIDALLAEDSIGFAPGSSEMDPASRELVATIAEVLQGCPGTRFEIGGHTDAQGRPELNQRISEARAAAVLAALEAFDLPLVFLTAEGYGPDRPIADNATEEGRARNRRIAFTLLGADGAPASRPGDAAPGTTAAGAAYGPQ